MSLDPNIIQKFLTTFSPFIIKKTKELIQSKEGVRASLDNSAVLLEEPTGKELSLTEDEATDIANSQNAVLTDSNIIDATMAEEVYGDILGLSSGGIPNLRSLEYNIDHSFIYEFERNVYGKISIEKDINNNNVFAILNAKQDLPEIFVKNISIKNNSKDIYTSKLSYHVTITVGFSDFDKLVNKTIPIKPLTEVGENIAPQGGIKFLNLLYKDFNVPGTSLEEKHTYDSNGLFLQLKFLPKPNTKYFKYIKNQFPNGIVKTLHLTYKKHDFTVFKQNNPLPIGFQHELTIEYVSQEADISPKVNLRKDIEAMSGNDDLFSLLKLKSKTTENSDFAKNLTIEQVLENIDKAKKATSEFKKILSCLPVNEDFSKKTFPVDGKRYTVAQLEEEIKKNRQNIIDYKNLIKLELAKKVESFLPTYELTVPQVFLNLYEQDNFEKDFMANGGQRDKRIGYALAALSVVGFAAFVAITGGTALAAAPAWASAVASATAGATAFGAGFGAYSSISSANEKEKQAREKEVESLNLDTQELINNIETKLSVKRIPKTTTTYAIKSQTATVRIGSENAAEEEKKIAELRKQSIDAVGAGNVGSLEQARNNQKSSIKFVLFGDIVSLLASIAPNVRFVFGGKVFKINSTSFGYINFYNIPIALANLREFLIKHIVDRPNYFYNTDVFLKEIFDVLLKRSLQNASGDIDPNSSLFLPNKLFMNSTIHENTDLALETFGNGSVVKKYIASKNDSDFLEFKKNFIKTKNFTGTGEDNQFIKVVSILSMEELKTFDFYRYYRVVYGPSDDTAILRKETDNVSSYSFQKYINNYFLKPCILITSTGANDTILKNKNLSFTRVDNSNLAGANTIDGKPLYRLPYNFSGDLKSYLFFFLGVGSYFFVSPPQSLNGKSSSDFGFGGLYMLTKLDYEYSFLKTSAEGVKIPNLDSKVTISGVHISYGDSYHPKDPSKQNGNIQEPANNDYCADIIKSAEPI